MRAEGAGTRSGLVVVDKARGWTSHDVVAKCRRVFAERKVGHAGTLDPDATGVLLVGLGRATRLLRYLSALPKSYSGEIVLGTATSTLDSTGEVVGKWDMDQTPIERVRQAASSLTGEILQVPPMVSALKVGGRRLHEAARKGEEVDRSPRAVTIRRFDVVAKVGACAFSVLVDCSSGTYVRSLASDLGAWLGGGAHLRNLRRTAVGSFTVTEAKPVEALSGDSVVSAGAALRDYPRLVVGEQVATSVSHGTVLDKVALGASGQGPWAVLGEDDRLLGVYEALGGEKAKPSVILAPD